MKTRRGLALVSAVGRRWLSTAGTMAVLWVATEDGSMAAGESKGWLLDEVLEAPHLETVVQAATDYRLQIVLGTVVEGPDGLTLRQETFRAGEEYFYPASSVKMLAAIAAAELVEEWRERRGWPVDLETPLVYHPQFEAKTLEAENRNNVVSGRITVGQAIREIFLVSDNQAYNYLYELVGPDGLAHSARAAGLEGVRIVHRLSEFRTPEEHRMLPRIDLVTLDGTYVIPARTSEPLPPLEAIDGLEIGAGYLSDGVRVERAMDFSEKNAIPLVELQRALCMLVRPDVDCGGHGWSLEPKDREWILESMEQYPRESANPIYDEEEYPDDYVKPLLPGVARVLPKERVRILNKTGQAYGFSVENAWVSDRETGQGFFLAATLYTNTNQTLNDDEYEYDEVATPFLEALGEAIADHVFE